MIIDKNNIIIIVFILYFFLTKNIYAISFNSNQNYEKTVFLISDIQNYFNAESACIIYSHNSKSFETTTFLHTLIRKLSNENKLSLTLSYNDTTLHRNFYGKRISKSFYVVLLDSEKEIDWLKQFTAIYDPSRAFWIVIFTNAKLNLCHQPNGNPFNLVFDSNVLVKCQDDPIVREWYSVHESETKTYDLAEWKPKMRFRLLTNQSKYDRRYNLEGKTLDAVMVKGSAVMKETNNGQLEGYFAKILLNLSKTLNFTIKLKKTKDTWVSGIEVLARNEVDIGVSEFSMVKEQLDMVKFTLPMMLFPGYLFIRQPTGSVLNWTAYVRVYPTSVWYALNAMLILSIILIIFIKTIHKIKQSNSDSIFNTMLQIWGMIYCQQCLPDFPKQSSLRLAYFSIFVKSWFIYTIYAGNLISFLTITNPTLNFNDINGLANDGTYKLINIRDSSSWHYFMTSNDPIIKKLRKSMPETKFLPNTVIDGFNEACMDKKKAFFMLGDFKDLIQSEIQCNLVPIKTGFIYSISVPLKKNSSYRGLFNHHLLKFRDFGTLHRYKTEAFRKVKIIDNQFTSVEFSSVILIFSLLMIGIFCSFVILSCEIIYQFFESYI